MPHVSVTQNGKFSCWLTKKLLPQPRAGASFPAGRPERLLGRRTVFLPFPASTRQRWDPAPSRPVFQVSQAHPWLCKPELSLLGQSHRAPHAAEPGLFGDNGGNVKQGLKMGREPLILGWSRAAGGALGGWATGGPGGMEEDFPSCPQYGAHKLPGCDQGASSHVRHSQVPESPGHFWGSPGCCLFPVLGRRRR